MRTVPLDIKENHPMRDLTTFGVGGPARFFTEAVSEDDVVSALGFAKARNIPIFVLGGGSNVLISDEGFPGLIILIGIKGFKSQTEGEDVLAYAGAGEDWQQFVDLCISRAWQGVECLAGIPGRVGASPVQNIGAYGQDVSQTIAGVRTIEIDTTESVYISNKECGFGYRKSTFNSFAAGKYIITGVTFRLKRNGAPSIRYREIEKYFENSHDITIKQVRDAVISIRDAKGLLIREGHDLFRSAGSFFKNPIVSPEQFKEIESFVEQAGGCSNWAWQLDSGDIKISAACLIQSAGFKRGYRKGNVGISPKHALIIVNYGGASAYEIVGFASEVQKRVFDDFGIFLTPEIRLAGFPSSCLCMKGE
ncbi:MAG: UDP-N-acetylmuramate dehydrogenase [Dissulfurispiraceae bacterium]